MVQRFNPRAHNRKSDIYKALFNPVSSQSSMKSMKRQRITDGTNDGNFESYRAIVPSDGINPQTFFKLMLSPTSQSIKLRIPEKFTKAYNDELCTSTNATLTVPTGETWEVTLIKEDNKLWFYRGWHEFVNNYSIDYGYFLMFKYEGNMKFNVHVFDLTTCEISYQCDMLSSSAAEKEHCPDYLGLELVETSKKEVDACDEEEDDDSEFECLGSPLSNPDDYSDAKVVELDSEDDNDGDTDDDDDDGDEEEVKSLDEGRSTHSNVKVVARQGTSFAGGELPKWLRKYKTELKAVTVAGIPIPKTDFFLSEVKFYSLFKSLYLNIPKAFARELLGHNDNGVKFIKLEVADGRQWEVKCMINRGKSMFGRGWSTFARDYGLEIGDVCVYEVTPSNRNLLQVQVVKYSQIKASELAF